MPELMAKDVCLYLIYIHLDGLLPVLMLYCVFLKMGFQRRSLYQKIYILHYRLDNVVF